MRVWILRPDARFCAGAFGRNPASAAVKISPRLIKFLNNFAPMFI